MSGPNPFRVTWSMMRVLARVQRPNPSGETGSIDHAAFAPILAELASTGPDALPGKAEAIDRYIAELASNTPDALSRDESLAFWLNLYNAGALRLVAAASASDQDSVLRVPGGFDRPFVTVAGEPLSLDAIEHAKIRRFGDPRIHGALVCGAVSCPTLRSTPYDGGNLEGQLADQMRYFLASGGATLDGPTLRLSRIFRWYGADFVRPHRMPSVWPVSGTSVAGALLPWLPIDAANAVTSGVKVEFQPYRWGLRCAVR